MAELSWIETDGPPVARNPVPGFGNKLISRVIGYDLQGSAAMGFEPVGLRCRLTFRISQSRSEMDGGKRARARRIKTPLIGWPRRS